MSHENSQTKPQERRNMIPNYLECEESKMIERIISHGFQDFIGHDDWIQDPGDLRIYWLSENVHDPADFILNWAFEILIIEEG